MIKVEVILRNPKDLTKIYIIDYKDENSVWISDGSGEGAEFNSQKFYDAIDRFYKDNF